MSRIIVVTSGKGGVGKTTTTANLGMALAQRKRKVILVDADFGLRNLDLLLGLENRVVYTAVEAIAGECRLDQAIVRDKRQNSLALLPAAQNRMKDAVTPAQMRQLVMALAKSLIMSLSIAPPGLNRGSKMPSPPPGKPSSSPPRRLQRYGMPIAWWAPGSQWGAQGGPDY